MTDRTPSSGATWAVELQRAQALAGQGDLVGAYHRAADLRARAPDFAPAGIFAAFLELRLGRYREARALALAVAAQPVAADGVLDAARLLKHLEAPESLARMFDASGWRALRAPQALAELAQILGFSGLYAQADDCLAQTLALAPGDPDALYLKGMFALFAGDDAAATAALRAALQVAPHMANVHFLLSMQDTPETAGRHIEQILRVIHVARPGSEARAMFEYALHQSHHALGAYDEAWAALERGHAVMRAAVPYDATAQRALIETLKRRPLAAAPARAPLQGEAGSIFIVGMFRSGTSLLERILAGHPEVADGGETYQFSAALREAANRDSPEVVDIGLLSALAPDGLAGVRARMHDYARWRGRGKRWVTEKLPLNFLNVGLIAEALPDASLLHMQRDPVATCFSNLRTLFRVGTPYACDQRRMAHYFGLYRELMAHWRAVLPSRVLDIDYADIVADPEREAKRVMTHCGLAYVPGALERGQEGGNVATASAAHARKGILGGRSQAWKPYEKHLQPLLDGLRACGAIS